MKRRIWAAVLAVVMTASALTGCASQTETTPAQTEATQGNTEKATEAATQAVTTEAATEAPTTKAAETAPETTEPAEEPTTEEVVELPMELAIPDYMIGGLQMIDEIELESEKLDEKGQSSMERAIRAYTPKDSLLINNAKDFYYYSQLDSDGKQIYDAMLMVAEDPTTTEHYVPAIISVDPDSDEFSELLTTAYLSLLLDHAELFWLYNSIESDFALRIPFIDPAPAGKHTVYLQLTTPFKNYKKEMNAFNDAVDAFLADIDLEAPDEQIAMAIHDKLVDMVTYDNSIYEGNVRKDLGHTAYGALVADSSGIPNYAVCDGYSQAYVYLLQQAGINAAVIIGMAGPSRTSAGGHAWSVVELGGEWYEVDSTWDDIGGKEEQAERLKKENSINYVYYYDALSDEEYKGLMKHYLFNVTTDEITDFQLAPKHFHRSSSLGCAYSLLGNSVHIRSNPDMAGLSAFGLVVQMAPVATGTQYAYH